MLFFRPVSLLAMLLLTTSCPAQRPTPAAAGADRLVGGPCEGCEAVFEYGGAPLSATDTLPGFAANEPKLHIEGTVFRRDGITPAAGVIVYIYHTGRDGTYRLQGGETGWGRRHGMYRGWVMTGADGRYAFNTFRPAAYPDGSEPEHIHLTVKEPGFVPYYLDDFVFTDDPGLSEADRVQFPGRGGSGLVLPVPGEGVLKVTRNLILGLNIPDYPQ